MTVWDLRLKDYLTIKTVTNVALDCDRKVCMILTLSCNELH